MTGPVFSYVLTKRDFLNAQRLYRSRNPRAALSYYFWIWLLPALGICTVFAAAWAYRQGDFVKLRALAPIAGAGLWLAIFLPICRYYSIRKLWKQSVETTDGKPVQLQFNEEQLISRIPGKSEGHFLWSAILKFEEDEHIALLFILKKNFLYIPKAALPEAAWEQLRQHIART